MVNQLKSKTVLNINKESIIVATKSALHVVQKMLANGRLVKKTLLGANSAFAKARKTVATLRGNSGNFKSLQ